MKVIIQRGVSEYFLLLARVLFGSWLAYVGLVKWASGPSGFVAYITTEFAKTWSPEILNITLGWLIVISEPLLGLWLLTGKSARMAWTCSSILMWLLVMGKTMLGDHAVVANNFQYLVLCMVCAGLARDKQ